MAWRINRPGHVRDVEIELSEDPRTGLLVRYAMTQDGESAQGGRAAGRMGQLRDSDPLVGYATARPLYNYAVSFEAPVPWSAP